MALNLMLWMFEGHLKISKRALRAPNWVSQREQEYWEKLNLTLFGIDVQYYGFCSNVSGTTVSDASLCELLQQAIFL